MVLREGSGMKMRALVGLMVGMTVIASMSSLETVHVGTSVRRFKRKGKRLRA